MTYGRSVRHYLYDALTAFTAKDGLTLTASDVVQMDAADRIIKLGDGRVDAMLVIDVLAIDVSSGDETYTFHLEGGDAADFSGNVEPLATLDLGHSSVRPGNGNVTSLIGRYEVSFQNFVGEAEYPWQQLNLIAAGTTPSITFAAFIAPRSY